MTRGIQWLAISALVALLVSRYVSISSGELDDFAVLRASAWLRTCAPDDDVPRVLHDHLASHADALPMAARERFRLRMDFVSNYVLTGPILRLLEGSMGVSAL